MNKSVYDYESSSATGHKFPCNIADYISAYTN